MNAGTQSLVQFLASETWCKKVVAQESITLDKIRNVLLGLIVS